MGLTTYTDNHLLGSLFGNTPFSVPTFYVGLHVGGTAPTIAGAATEPSSADNYARVAITNNTTNFPTPTTGSVANAVAVAFNKCQTADWGTVTHYLIYDAATVGTLLAFEALSTSKVVTVGDTPSLAVNAISATLS